MSNFKTRARIIKQLGEQLIKNEAIALLELIKNSYDADASLCSVKLTDIDNKEKGSIEIKDNGEGMTDDIFKNIWLEIGTSHKNDLTSQTETKRSHKFKRMRIGEKGIGRLGVHRLGSKLTVISRKINITYLDIIISMKNYSDEKVSEVLNNIVKTLVKDRKASWYDLIDETIIYNYFRVNDIAENSDLYNCLVEELQKLKNKKSFEYVLSINWDEIENYDFIEDIPVTVKERKPEIFLKNSGVLIIIKKLNNSWTRKMLRDCYRSVMSLNSPFRNMQDSFKVDFDVNNDWLKGMLSFSDIERYKLFSFSVEMTANKITDFSYKFTPWDVMKKLNYREITISDKEICNLLKMVYRDGTDINLSKYKIGKIRFEGIIFDLDSRVLDLEVEDKAGLKKYLKDNGGVYVFRDNLRVLDYGEPENDWLDLSGRRINVPTRRISNNIIIGAVYLDRESSQDLIEKANREGFIENEAYQTFVCAISLAVDRIESLRKTDKDLLRKYYGPEKSFEPVVTNISELKEIIDKNVKESSAKNEINRYLERIQTEYTAITESLIKSAGAGLNLVIVIHQIDKIIKDIKVMLKQKVSTELLKDKIEILSSLVEGYSILVKKADKKFKDIKSVLSESIFSIGFRLQAHNIKLVKQFENNNREFICWFSEDHVMNALLNIFDNSIWWLGYSNTKDKEIYIDISEDLKDYVSVIIADNGPGFSKSVSEITKPFVTDKPGGMGIGLHLTEKIMESLKGKLIFPEMEYFNIPEKYKKGAKIVLAFKKNKE